MQNPHFLITSFPAELCDVLLRPWPNSSAASARPSSRSGRQCHAPRSPWPRGSAAEAPGQLTDGGFGGIEEGKLQGNYRN